MPYVATPGPGKLLISNKSFLAVEDKEDGDECSAFIIKEDVIVMMLDSWLCELDIEGDISCPDYVYVEFNWSLLRGDNIFLFSLPTGYKPGCMASIEEACMEIENAFWQTFSLVKGI